jgi:hypothetical protein
MDRDRLITPVKWAAALAEMAIDWLYPVWRMAGYVRPRGACARARLAHL